ncbi:MAG: component system cellobiose-specific enzyme, partial [Sporomusa sp.]|nr:component system cellobiose-specific enzyme [Sporomusa sp.]
MNVMRLADGIANQRHVNAVRRGLLINLPLVVIGAFTTMMSNLTFLWYHQLMISYFGPNWTVLWQSVTNASLNGMSILLVLSTSYFLAQEHYLIRTGQVHSLSVSLVSFSCLMALIQPIMHEGINGMPFAWTGVGGIFFALFTA